jgi:neutral ceramidase
MQGLNTLLLVLLSLGALTACDEDKPERVPVDIQAGAPMAGVAEGVVDFPVGTPLGGYSSRCNIMGSAGRVDKRTSAYTTAFTSSAGVQTPSRAQALWLTNGDQDWVLIKVDVIYIFDEMVRDLERRLSKASGRDLSGRVVLTASHTHHAPGNFSDSYHFYLGGDRYSEEIYQRMTGSLESIALDAWSSMSQAAIGFGMVEDWDPDDLVYSDRRDENNELQVWEDQEAGQKKDPILWLLRVDHADGTPMGVFFNFGIHGTVLGGDNAMISTDAPGHVEYALAAQFDAPVVVSHLQGSGGDAAPRGSDVDYARLESLGVYAADAIHGLWERTPVSTDPFFLETATRSIQEGLEEIHVSRNGTVDWHYPAYDEEAVPDNKIYGADGQILSPLDEFKAQYGGAFCGYDDPMISTGTIGADVYPYDGCMQVELISWVISGIFQLGDFDIPLPLPSSQQAVTSATQLGPVSVMKPDGTVVDENVTIGFFPGETTQMFVEQFQRRSQAELGLDVPLAVGYAQDHEGYLLIPEDWLLGGYEPNINVWGPLQAEHIMEGTLDLIEENLLTRRLEPADVKGEYPNTQYEKRLLPEDTPDVTATAGTAATEIPETLYTPLPLRPDEEGESSFTPQLQPDSTIARVQGLAQFIFMGGDPAVGTPTVTLEQKVNGRWTEVLSASGRPISDTLPDILLSHTPDPLYPYYDAQNHYWWASWQAVGHYFDRTAVPLGWYRLKARGDNATGASQTWPWDSEPYTVTSDPFEVVPAEISVEYMDGTVSASIDGPSAGYRLIDIEGSSVGQNPVHEATITWTLSDFSETTVAVEGTHEDGLSLFEVTAPEGAVELILTDSDGNSGVHFFETE